MSTEERIVGFAEMAEMVDRDLFIAIGRAIDTHAEGKQITLSTVEVTLAAFLGQEVGESCNNIEEVGINGAAYGSFILSVAMGGHQAAAQKKAMN